MKSDTLMKPDERKAQTIKKQNIVLSFLKDETYTHVDVLQKLLGFKNVQNVNSTMKKLERDNLVKRASIDVSYGRPITLWGITTTGLHHAFGLDEQLEDRPVFEPSKAKGSTLQHRIDLQLARITAEQAGWTEWVSGQLLGKRMQGMKIPDAIATNPQGEKIAIELERTIKTRKRYADILVSHLRSKKEGLWSKIYYLSPSVDFSLRLRRAFHSIETAQLNGSKFKLKEEHFLPFHFYSFNDKEWLNL